MKKIAALIISAAVVFSMCATVYAAPAVDKYEEEYEPERIVSDTGSDDYLVTIMEFSSYLSDTQWNSLSAYVNEGQFVRVFEAEVSGAYYVSDGYGYHNNEVTGPFDIYFSFDGAEDVYNVITWDNAQGRWINVMDWKITDGQVLVTTLNDGIFAFIIDVGPVITTQPKDFTGAVGDTAIFKVKAQGTGLKYQWQTYSSGKWVNSSLTGAKTSKLSVPVTKSRDGYKFRCVITDPRNRKIVSNKVVLHVAVPISIVTQPKDYSGPAGSTATFKVKAQGTGLKYQWQTYKDGKWVNSTLPGSNTATLSVDVKKARDGYKFRCVVTDAYKQQIITNKVTLRVIASVPLAIITQPRNYTGVVGSTAAFKVKAQGNGLKYQWQTYKNGKWVNSSLDGSNSSTLYVEVTKARNGYKFRCVVTDVTGKKVTSNTVTIKVG